MQKTIRSAIYLVTLTLIASCGGGGGGTITPSSNTPAVPVSSAVVTTLAGGGSQAVNATGSSASFYHPMGVAVDSSGNVYVADAGNNQIRKISSSGSVTLLAGSRSKGSADGTGSAASFNSPFGVAVDSSGNVYVADTLNSMIRKITPTGVVTTIGAKNTAKFTQPEGIAVDANGNVYVSDISSHSILKITPAGVISTLAGNYASHGFSDGTGTAATFFNPKGIAVDSSGNIYVADTNNQALRKITPAGVVTTVASSLGSISNVVIDGSGNIYVSDHGEGTIRKLTLPGPSISLLVSSGILRTPPRYNSAWQTTNKPYGMAVDSNGTLYVSDTWNNQVVSVNTSNGSRSVLAGSPSYGSTDGQGIAAKFKLPSGVAEDSSGNLFVADTGNCLIRKITPSGSTSTFAGSTTCGSSDGLGSNAAFTSLSGIAIDSSNNIYVADLNSVRKITPAGLVSTLAGSSTSGSADGTGGSATFNRIKGIVVDRNGNVFVTDTGNFMIRKITPAGVVTTIAGSTTFGIADGVGTSAQFMLPFGITIDSSGNLFVSEFTEDLIRKITPAGVVTTFAGGAISTSQNLINGTGSAAKFAVPAGLSIDSADNIYVADTYNNSIRKISPSGEVSKLAGDWYNNIGNLDSTGYEASFFNPNFVTVGSGGVIYVSDTWNDLIRKIIP